VKNSFPTLGVIGGGELARMCVAPAAALGVDLLMYVSDPNDSSAQICNHEIGSYKDLSTIRKFAKNCDVITFVDELIPLSIIRAIEADGVVVRPSSAVLELSQNKETLRLKLLDYPGLVYKKKNGKVTIEEPLDFDDEITVIVARSPHGQATTWSPTMDVQKDGISVMSITPVPKLSQDLSERVQKMALEIAEIAGLVGVAAVEMFVKGEEIFIKDLAMGPHNSGLWTIEGARTSQFEQHLRAVLDLPLGDPRMTAPITVVGHMFIGKKLVGKKVDLYRPYLHLMARTPALKFHQYRNEVSPGHTVGHITLLGDSLEDLTSQIQHAIDYMSGEIDE
jgi:5-(carboxyamino)imidazole ribonucleotide synthase